MKNCVFTKLGVTLYHDVGLTTLSTKEASDRPGIGKPHGSAYTGPFSRPRARIWPSLRDLESWIWASKNLWNFLYAAFKTSPQDRQLPPLLAAWIEWLTKKKWPDSACNWQIAQSKHNIACTLLLFLNSPRKRRIFPPYFVCQMPKEEARNSLCFLLTCSSYF